ncbi:unnamed protein product (macronuclear) [Paramecium tetraurelia]|uniref:Uncharacterized protein n=1 Tax=Paramecium tetraurelia TaxID=5888 RepID=A0CHC3_PARTE|nr:uncharacterized protein GSPATT00038292001 [Paramecium tetraurelia]CAK70190.1 unnamed protein product [Paramecium tetraurelia]|eukprot:XP_001437587.1 hypothetical protein (macronuclear) [Paramecium tetraurelia strain d4-2]
MQRVPQNTVKETLVRVVIPKQSSQPNIYPEQNNFFHIPPKFQQSRLTIKQPVSTSKSIEEKRYKQPKNNFSENTNNRTNCSSKSRVMGTMQFEDDSLQSSQNGQKLRKIVGDSHLFSTTLLQQLSKQNLNTNLTNDSQSPAQRKPKNQELHNLNTQIQSIIIKKKYHSKWEIYKEQLFKQSNLLHVYKHQFIQSTPINDISIRIINNLFEMMNNISIEILCEQESKFNEIIDKINREKELCLNNYKVIEKERDLLIDSINQLKSSKQQQSTNAINTINAINPIQIDSEDTVQLKEIQIKLQEMSEKEAKLIKLVLAIKRSGIDIEKIYNEEVLNDESVLESEDKLQGFQQHNFERNDNDADNSIVNDSDESSFCFLNRFENDSILESVRKFQYKNLEIKTNSVKFKLDLSNLQSKSQSNNQIRQQNNKSQTIQVHQSKLKVPVNQGSVGFHQEFMSRINEFSESWRIQALKDEKKNKS